MIGLVMVPATDLEMVLVGVRSTEGNTRHPGVVSVPTMRVPLDWATQQTGVVRNGESRPLAASTGTFGRPGSSSMEVGYALEALLAKKIVDGTLLDKGAVSGRCAFRLAMRGQVDDPSGADGEIEDTLMLTILAICDSGMDALPGRTHSYSQLEWVRSSDLLKAWRQRDGQLLFPDSNPLEVCIRGLCVESAVHLLGTAKAVSL
ncbi:hypothetical protein ABZ780_07315 [Micromonospora sp. NPDC047467]|uniref:hypothetical protein n=1 Tax=Micromonospora sp. NPDC047467 TaxID=3154814 RepID=UPI0033D2AFA1